MKNRFKLLSVILCLVAFATMALGSGSTESSTKEVVATEENSASADSEADSVTEQETLEVDAAKSDVTIDEQVLVDQDGIKITATEYTTDSI